MVATLEATQEAKLEATIEATQNTTRISGSPSYVNFDIKFLPEGENPTNMVITPDDGDAFLEPVILPGARDNMVVWRSNREFKIRLVNVDDQTKESVAILEEGDPHNKPDPRDPDWYGAKRLGDQSFERTLRLKRATGNKLKVTVAAKYLVKLVKPEVVFDPVLIITH